jgi:hypothetical protein
MAWEASELGASYSKKITEIVNAAKVRVGRKLTLSAEVVE